MPRHINESVDMLEVAKYLQGKTYRDIKQTVMKIKRKLPAYFTQTDGITAGGGEDTDD